MMNENKDLTASFVMVTLLFSLFIVGAIAVSVVS